MVPIESDTLAEDLNDISMTAIQDFLSVAEVRPLPARYPQGGVADEGLRQALETENRNLRQQLEQSQQHLRETQVRAQQTLELAEQSKAKTTLKAEKVLEAQRNTFEQTAARYELYTREMCEQEVAQSNAALEPDAFSAIFQRDAKLNNAATQVQHLEQFKIWLRQKPMRIAT